MRVIIHSPIHETGTKFVCLFVRMIDWRVYGWSFGCLKYWLFGCLYGRLLDCITGCLTAYMVGCLAVCMSDCLTVCMAGCLAVCIVDGLIACIDGCLTVYMTGSLTVCMTVCLTACMAGCLNVTLTGWLTVYMVGCLAFCMAVYWLFIWLVAWPGGYLVAGFYNECLVEITHTSIVSLYWHAYTQAFVHVSRFCCFNWKRLWNKQNTRCSFRFQQTKTHTNSIE